MSSIVLIDAGSFNYYRVTATMSWYRHQKDAPPMSLQNTDFLTRLESQARSCLEKFQKTIKKNYGLHIPLSEMYFIRDCPRETIWRHSYYRGYKSNRDDREQKQQQKMTKLSGEDLQIAIDKQPGQYIKYLHEKLAPQFRNGKPIYVKGAEADDVIAVLTKFFLETGVHRIFIVSLDSDYVQLIDPQHAATPRFPNAQVHLFSPKTWTETVCPNPKEALKAKILAGDNSDCIKKITFTPGSSEYWHQYRENSQMIDFNYIPIEIQNNVVASLGWSSENLPLSWKRMGVSQNWSTDSTENISLYFQKLISFGQNIYGEGVENLVITILPPIMESDLAMYQEYLFEVGRILRSLRLKVTFSPESSLTKTILTLMMQNESDLSMLSTTAL